MSPRSPAVGPFASGAVGPADLVDVGDPLPAVAAFLLVGGVGALLRHRRADFLDSAVDAAVERPVRSPIYGVTACAVGWLAGVYLVGQVLRLSGGLGTVAAALAVGSALGVAGAGFAVVGTGLATAAGDGRAWAGPLVGAVGSAAVWLALPALAALVVWTLVAAAGIGGPVRKWVHASRSVGSAERP